MQTNEHQAQRIRKLETQLAEIDVKAREARVIARCAQERIDRAIRDSDRRAERYLPILRRYGLLPEQQDRRRLF